MLGSTREEIRREIDRQRSARVEGNGMVGSYARNFLASSTTLSNAARSSATKAAMSDLIVRLAEAAPAAAWKDSLSGIGNRSASVPQPERSSRGAMSVFGVA